MSKPKYGIYAIVDTLAADLVGMRDSITLHRHDATAIRMFSDIANNPQTSINAHVEDYVLVCLGYINDDNQILCVSHSEAEGGFHHHRVVLTGTAWKAAQEKQP